MKIEAGKYYKMRNGEKAYVAGVNPDNSKIMCCVGWDVSGNQSWTIDGRFSLAETCDFDIIEEWREQKKVKIDCWLNVYKDDVCAHDTKEDAEDSAMLHRIACIHIEREVVEGTYED